MTTPQALPKIRGRGRRPTRPARSTHARRTGFRRGVAILACIPAAFCAPPAQAGGGPQNVLVVVNDSNRESLEIGTYYAAARGIAPRQILHLAVPPNSNLPTNSFETLIRQPVDDYLAATGLGDQIDYLVFAFDRPFRAQAILSNVNGLTATAYYGYYDAPPAPPCSINPAAANPYYDREESFRNDAPFNPSPRRLATMLATDSRDEIKIAIDRSAAADATMPLGQVFLLHTTDVLRNVQWPQFEDTTFRARFLDNGQTWRILDSNEVTGETDIIGYTAGRSSLLDTLFSNTFLPGALGDHLTSFGARLDNTLGQMSILEWIRAGCAGSYGTVIEPCNYTEKFPHVRAHYWYGRGFNLAESYVMAVHSPYQGLTVGDPLCAPYAIPPAVQVSGISTGAVVSGTVNLNVTATAPDANRRVTRIDLFLDDQWLTTLYDTGPTAGNIVTATVDGKSKSYTVQSGDGLSDIAQGLANAINAPAPPSQRLDVTAAASTDRIEFRQRDADLGQSDTRAYSVSVGQGTGGALTLNAWTGSAELLETEFAAIQELTIQGTPQAGDTLRLIVTRTDAVPVTNTVTAVVGDTHVTLINTLVSAVNNDPGLQVPAGCLMKYVVHFTSTLRSEAYLVARTAGWDSYNLTAAFTVTSSALSNTSFSGNFESNADVMGSRGTIFLAAGETGPASSYDLTTTALPDGPHSLRAVAYEGTAVAAQGHAIIPFTIDNHATECSVDEPYDGSRWIHGESIPIGGSATSDVSITRMVLYAEGKSVATSSVGTIGTTLDTLDYGVGLLPLQCLAIDSTGRTVLSDMVYVEILPDYDNDGLADDWELEHYAGIEMYGPGDDPDHDGANMEAEFRADTDPLEPESLFAIQLDFVAPDNTPRLRFPASTRRLFQIEYNDVGMTVDAAWTPVFPSPFTGSGGEYVWVDDGTLVPVAASDRFYRVTAGLR